MKPQGFRRIFCSLLLLALPLCVSRAATNILFVPKDAATKFGASWSDVLTVRGWGQQLYSSNAFSGATGEVIWITEIAFRAEETYGDLDAWFERLAIHLNVFPGSMEEVVERRTGLVPPIRFVYNGTNVQINARSGLLDAFDARFPISPAFRYDRSAGQLVLYISRGQRYDVHSGSGFDMSSAGESYELGAYFFPDNFRGDIQIGRGVFTTRFTYQNRAAEIRSLIVVNGGLRLDFTVSGPDARIELEAADKISGPFARLAAEVVQVAKESYYTTVAIPSTNRFFRISLQD